jgi:taurine dioxygenase
LIVNLGKMESVEGLTQEDSGELITELAALIDRSGAVLRHQWSEGDVLIADNWAVLHRATPPVEGEQRVLHRVSVVGL